MCLGILISSARRENLERTVELAVEKAAERVAERAVEKALDDGNITTKSKIVHKSYSNFRKYPHKEKKNDYSDSDYEPLNNKDADDWNRYSHSTFMFRRTKDRDFHA